MGLIKRYDFTVENTDMRTLGTLFASRFRPIDHSHLNDGYSTSADQTQFLGANNLPTALTTDATVQWHWQSTINFPDAEGQATVRLFENGKPGATLDQVYWNPDGLQAINAHCDATCQADPNREAVVSLQLDDYTYDPINPWDESKWTTAEATAKGKGTSQPEAPSAVRGLLKKEYELKDHLGNVHVVVTDRKHSLVSGLSVTDFKADVVVMRDYYPFGMEMEGQRYAAGEYRYGFNGMERDNELKGSGDSYNFGARMYDPRIGRWMSRDPFESKYPGISTFASMANSPIRIVDVDGNDIYLFDEKDNLMMIVKAKGVDIGYRMRSTSRENLGLPVMIDPLTYGSMSKSERTEWISKVSPALNGASSNLGFDVYGIGVNGIGALLAGMSGGFEVTYFPSTDEWALWGYEGPALGVMIGAGGYGLVGNKHTPGKGAATYGGAFLGYSVGIEFLSFGRFWSVKGDSPEGYGLFTNWNPGTNDREWEGYSLGGGPGRWAFGLAKTHTWYTPLSVSSGRISGPALEDLKAKNQGVEIMDQNGNLENYSDEK